VPAVIRYSNDDADAVVGVEVTVGNHTVDLIVGLGKDPAVAEEIISSLRAVS